MASLHSAGKSTARPAFQKLIRPMIAAKKRKKKKRKREKDCNQLSAQSFYIYNNRVKHYEQ